MMKALIDTLRRGAQICRERNQNNDYASIADKAADAIERLETELLAATIRIDNDADRVEKLSKHCYIQAESIEVLRAKNVRLAAERDALATDAASWRAYKARKDAVINAGMGVNPMRDSAIKGESK